MLVSGGFGHGNLGGGKIKIKIKSIGRGWAWGVQINFVPPSNIVDEGGQTIPRCRVALGPNCLFGYSGVGGLRISP